MSAPAPPGRPAPRVDPRVDPRVHPRVGGPRRRSRRANTPAGTRADARRTSPYPTTPEPALPFLHHADYLASEVHASYGPLFGPGTDEFKTAQKAKLATKFTYVAELLGDKHFLGGDKFTVADAYLFVMCGWAGYVGFDLAAHPKITAFQARVAELAFVKEAQAAMAAAP